VAEKAGTLEILKQLALVTYADISAVNPTALSPWRREQLWRVYLAGYNELTRELAAQRIRGAPLAGVAGAAEFLEGFPVRYLRRHTEAEIAAHFALAERSRETGAAVELERRNGFYSLAIVTGDRPALLASIAGALAGFGMDIVKAEAFANGRGTILDTFVFTDPHRTLELNPSEADRLRLTLERVAVGKVDVRELLRRRPAARPPSKRARIRSAVSFDGEASDQATLIQVVAEDRPGLLYALASAISSSGANIEIALIDTEAHRAIDAFYVTVDGKKLNAAEQAALREKLLLACSASAG
jgi:[protein-PII] uridylyltransferase